MSKPLKILMLEDSINDAEIVQHQLKKQNLAYTFQLVMDEQSFTSAIESFNPDVILADNSLPQFSATEALRIVLTREKHIPFIVVTGSISEEFAANIIKLGADDYILKDRMLRLPAAITGAIKQQHVAELALKAKEEIIREKIERQREVTRIILQTQEMDRNILGRELHDNINQMLASVSIRLGYFLEEPENNLIHIEQCLSTLQKAIAEIRKLSHTMVMPSFSQTSLKQELEMLIENYSYKKVIQLQVLIEENIPSTIKETLFRIAQEQLSNIAKHARARKIGVNLANSSQLVTMIIRDNGVGFNMQQKRKGIGLTNIFTRVEPYNGSATINSLPGKGCTLSIKIPLEV